MLRCSLVNALLILSLSVVVQSLKCQVKNGSESCDNNMKCVNHLCYKVIGPCINGKKCPEATNICVNNECLKNADEADNCVDKSAPGKASDCPQSKHLCNNTYYYDLMTEQCPKTCNRCNEAKKTCIDLAAPGRPSDCPNVQYLCTNPLYLDIMKKQCRKTCGFCKP